MCAISYVCVCVICLRVSSIIYIITYVCVPFSAFFCQFLFVICHIISQKIYTVISLKINKNEESVCHRVCVSVFICVSSHVFHCVVCKCMYVCVFVSVSLRVFACMFACVLACLCMCLGVSL